MALKPNGKSMAILEQIIEDPVSGLTYQFEVGKSGDGYLRIFGDILPFGNREFQFSTDGKEVGAGTFISEPPRPGWLRKVDRTDA